MERSGTEMLHRSSWVSLAVSAAGFGSYWLWRVHWIFGAATFAICWHFLIVRPRGALEEALSMATWREWNLEIRILRNLGWRTRWEGSDCREPWLDVTHDGPFHGDQWCYRPDWKANGADPMMPPAECEAVVDFETMTMSIANGAATFTYALRPKGANEPHVECQLMSKESRKCPVEPVNSRAWVLDFPEGIDVAYHVYLRMKRDKRR